MSEEIWVKCEICGKGFDNYGSLIAHLTHDHIQADKSPRSSEAIARGTKIVCPLCESIIGEFEKDLHSREIIGVEHIRLYDAELHEGDEMLCPKCGFPFCVDTHPFAALVFVEEETEKGAKRYWMPFEFPNQLVLPYIIRYLKKIGRWRSEWDKYFKNDDG